MIIDCDTCLARPRACADCVVSYLLDQSSESRRSGGGPVDLDPAERAAVEVLASVGLVPPLRVVAPVPAGPPHHDAHHLASDERSRPVSEPERSDRDTPRSGTTRRNTSARGFPRVRQAG